MGTYIEANADIPLVRMMMARATDPPTSHEAARRVPTFRGDHKARIMEALSQGPAGQTEIASRTGLSVAAVSKRMKDLRVDGHVEACGRCRGGAETLYRRAMDGR